MVPVASGLSTCWGAGRGHGAGGMAKEIVEIGEELVVVGSGCAVVRLVARGSTEEASGGEVVGHAWQVVAAVGLGKEVGNGHIVQGAGKRVEAEEVEHGDVGRDLLGRMG